MREFSKESKVVEDVLTEGSYCKGLAHRRSKYKLLMITFQSTLNFNFGARLFFCVPYKDSLVRLELITY
jgi:hypothetical protein